ncbi:MAG: hypothetical protein HDQ97_05960 [Lachnospiraceae bacterium]|nr:hypothetical protein [Lachnospiraceae bacterium]
MEYEQLDIFSYLQPKEEKQIRHILSVGDKIGRNVLGETRIAIITEVEGLPNYPYYRTDSGCCYSYEEGLQNIEELLHMANEERKKYKTIIPCNLSERITVEYEPRKCDGVVLWAQIGIFENMLFWKEDVTYQFCELFDSQKKLMKEYEKRKKRILEDTYCAVHILDEEKPMRRLYWSNHHGMYADAEYVRVNG